MTNENESKKASGASVAEIRQAAGSDLASLVKLGLSLWPGRSAMLLTMTVTGAMARREAVYHLAFLPGVAVPVGFCEVASGGRLRAIYVSPDCRRRGIGRALAERAASGGTLVPAFDGEPSPEGLGFLRTIEQDLFTK